MKSKLKKATIGAWIDDILLTEETFVGTEEQIATEVIAWENDYPHIDVRYSVEDLSNEE
jgi:hypothetical protein